MQSELLVLRRASAWSSTTGVILTLPLGDKDGPSCAWGSLLPVRGWRAHRILINAGDHGSAQRRWRFALVGWRIGAAERTEITTLEPTQVTAQPEEGTHVHGLFMEGARWDKATNMLADSHPKELHPAVPVMYIKRVTADELVTDGVYICPVYTTTIRGPTFTFRAPLRTDRPPSTWVLAAVALLMQPDQ